MKFKALSVVAPAGDKIANGEKSIEVRSWEPPSVPLRDVVIVQNHNYLRNEGEEDSNAFAIAIVDFDQVKPWQENELVKACGTKFVSGYFGWHIKNLRKLEKPIKVKAKRKIYEVNLYLEPK